MGESYIAQRQWGHRVFSTVSNELEPSPWCSGVFTFLLVGRLIHLLVTRPLCRDLEWRYPMLPVIYPSLSLSCSPGKVGPHTAILNPAAHATLRDLLGLHLPHCKQPTVLPWPWDCHWMLGHVVSDSLAAQSHSLIHLIEAAVKGHKKGGFRLDPISPQLSMN